MILLFILGATVVVSLISLIGVITLGISKHRLQGFIFALVAFATGGLVGGALFHLLPESLTLGFAAFYYVALGILVFFILEKFLYWRHCHRGECDVHTFTYLNLIGDGLHNFTDGVVIAASFVTDVRLGVATSVAVALHEVPQELGDFGILVYGGFTVKKALLFNLLSAASCIVGGVATYFLHSYTSALKIPLLAFSAGGFLYIALVDLLPELRKKTGLRESLVQLVFILLGVGLLWGMRRVVPD